MGLTSSSCMSSHSVSSPVIIKNKRNKKSRIELFPKPHLSKENENEKKHPEPHRKRHVVDKLQSVESSLRIDTSDDQEFEVAIPDDLNEFESLGSDSFIESNDRNPIVRFSYSEGINQQYTLHDDPTYFIGWEVHVEGEGVGCIISCLGPFFSGVRFEVQLQDGRILAVPFTQVGETELSGQLKITFLQRIF